MAISVQKRGVRFQLRVTHALLDRPFFFTFDVEDEARSYGVQLRRLLDSGVVPAELLARPAVGDDPLVVQIVRAYIKDAPHLTPSDDRLLGTMLGELSGVRRSHITYAWATRYVQDLKRRDNLSPGTIRKRIGALARVIDWHLHSTESKDGNALRLLPVGYSQYTERDRDALPKGKGAKVDVRKDRRLHHGEQERILPHLGELDLLYFLIVNTGLRLREAYRLRADQVDTARGVLRVEGSKGGRGQVRPRVVPLVPALRERLGRHCEGRVGRIFPWWDGSPEALPRVTARLSYLFGKAFAAAGSPDLTEHDLRHEACCRWFEHRTGAGWTFSDIEICRIMGWTTMAMALRYASLRGEDLADRLDPTLRGASAAKAS